MIEHIGPVDDAVSLTISGPNVVYAAQPAVWHVQARDAQARPVSGFAVFAQIGHGSGRPYRGVTDAAGDVDFEFIFSTPSPLIQVQFAPGTQAFSAGERFPEDGRQSVTCAVIAPDLAAPGPVRLHPRMVSDTAPAAALD